MSYCLPEDFPVKRGKKRKSLKAMSHNQYCKSTACSLITTNGSKISSGIAIIAIIFIFLLTCPNAQAQTNTAFNPSDKFSIPADNGSVSFAVNGTYSKGTFENNTWAFTNLRLTGCLPLQNFQISAQNSNVTIVSYTASNNTVLNFQSTRLRYDVEGQGEQILNLGFGPITGGLNPKFVWSVTVNNNNKTVPLAEGKGWSVSQNGALIVNGETGNLSIVHTSFSESGVSNSNLPFYQQHSVAIVVTIAFALVVVVAVLIKVKTKEKPVESG